MSIVSTFKCKKCGETFSAPYTVNNDCPSCGSKKIKVITETESALSKLKDKVKKKRFGG